MTKLDERPTRQLTSREAATLIGSAVGACCQLAGVENARTAVLWWAEHWDEAAAPLIALSQKLAQESLEAGGTAPEPDVDNGGH